MKMAVLLSSLLLLTVAVITSGCQQSREEQVEDAAEDAAENMEELGEKASEAAEDAADEMEDRVDDLSLAPAERKRHEVLAANRYASFVKRIDELGFHLATIQRPGVRQVQTDLNMLREESTDLREHLAALRQAEDPKSWSRARKQVDLAFAGMSEQIQEIGNDMHELVCALHHHEGGDRGSTVLAAAR